MLGATWFQKDSRTILVDGMFRLDLPMAALAPIIVAQYRKGSLYAAVAWGALVLGEGTPGRKESISSEAVALP